MEVAGLLYHQHQLVGKWDNLGNMFFNVEPVVSNMFFNVQPLQAVQPCSLFGIDLAW